MRCRIPRLGIWALMMSVLATGTGGAASEGSITGTVADALGGRVSASSVKLSRDGRQIAEGTSGAQGEFAFTGLEAGRYQIEVPATGFATRLTDPILVGTAPVATEIRLQV